jgi:hypothetical protein
MALPCVTVTSLILPFPQVPSSTRTVAPFLMSSGSCLTTTWALQMPLAATIKTNAAVPVISTFMSKAANKPNYQSSCDKFGELLSLV